MAHFVGTALRRCLLVRLIASVVAIVRFKLIGGDYVKVATLLVVQHEFLLLTGCQEGAASLCSRFES